MPQSKHTVASIRFGYGLNGSSTGAANARALIKSLEGERHDPSVSFEKRYGDIARFRKIRKEKRAGHEKKEEKARRRFRATVRDDFRRVLQRAVESETGFGTRLTQFWADHFTVEARGGPTALLAGAHIEEAIRPNLTGQFGDLLVAASTHPAMLLYLDQTRSFGNNSIAAKKRGKGLNENLAREILELHTMGVGAGYVQSDVRQLAELMTGLTVGKRGRAFRIALSEPGAERVLGKTYARLASLGNIENALQDIALHPDTAEHICGKLVRHFVSDRPDPEQVGFMRERYLRTDGNLAATYAAMLEHPASWADIGGKVKQPFDFVASSMRALRIDVSKPDKATTRLLKSRLRKALLTMGQPYLKPGGPDGWPEEAEFWITPAGLAARIDWASAMASIYGQELDPREFLEGTLGDAATAQLRALAAGAEVKWEGIALVFASPEFNRR